MNLDKILYLAYCASMQKDSRVHSNHAIYKSLGVGYQKPPIDLLAFIGLNSSHDHNIHLQCILTYPNPFGQENNFFVQISEFFGQVKYIVHKDLMNN